MRILFDHQIFYYQFGGASKYFSKLLQYLPNDSWRCTALYPYSEYLKESGAINSHKKKFRGDSVIMEILNRPYTYIELFHGNYDIYHQTNFSVNSLKFAKNKPIVVTYHDSNLSTFDPHPEIVKRQEASLKRADAIVCVSENTKNDMLNLFNIDESKVHVIYHGIEYVDISTLPKERIVNDKYVLFVGRRSAYKNFEVMAYAFSEVHKHHPELKLVCTMFPFTENERLLFRNLGIEDSVICITASETEMKQLYRDAEVFVFPSLYEGFGMPILEAWDCGCPVILSDSSCFPEIAMNAALYFNPDDCAELTKHIIKVLENKTFRGKLIELGKVRVQDFSWELCAEKHLDVYKSLL